MAIGTHVTPMKSRLMLDTPENGEPEVTILDVIQTIDRQMN